MGNAHASRGGRGNRRGRRGPPRSGPSQAQNAATPIRQNPSAAGARPSAEIVLPATSANRSNNAPPANESKATNGTNGTNVSNGSNGHAQERPPSQRRERETQASEGGPDGTTAEPFVLSPPASERTSPYRFVGERRILPRDANRPRPTAHTTEPAEAPMRPTSASAQDAGGDHPTHHTRRVSEPAHAPHAFASRDDGVAAEEDDGDDGWTPQPRGDVRGDVGPLIDSLREVFVQDRAISSQGGSTRCGICYLHFPFSELEYREAEGYYVCPECKRALGPARLPMVRKQRRG